MKAKVTLAKLERPKPLRGMSAAQKTIWENTIASKPIEWWTPDTLPLVAEYVRAVDTCNHLDRRVSKALSGDHGELDDWLKSRDREAKRVVSIATRLRLTQQSRYTPGAAATVSKRQSASGNRPWD